MILREWSEYRVERMPESEIEKLSRGEVNDILMETATDAGGRFRFQEVAAPAWAASEDVGRTVCPWDVVAFAPGRGLAWAALAAPDQRRRSR